MWKFPLLKNSSWPATPHQFRPLPGVQMTDIKVVMIHWVTSLGCSCQSMDSVRSWIFFRNGPANGWVIFSKATRSWVPNLTLQKCRKVKTPACKTGGKWRFHSLRVTRYGFVWEYDTLKSQRLILIFLQNIFQGYPPSDFAVDCHPSNRLECLPCSACARRILQGQSWRNVRVPQERGRQTFGAFKNWLDLRQMLQETILFHEEFLGCPPSFCWKNILWDREHRSGTKAGPPYADLWIQL